MARPSLTAAAVAAVMALGISANAQDVATSESAQDAATPEDRATLWRMLELPAHRALQRVRETPGTELAPFTTDGCSGGLSDTWRVVADRFPAFAEAHRNSPPWESCCVVHDRAYHSGGADPLAEQSYAARLSADEALQACVAQSAGTRVSDLGDNYGLTEDEVDSAYDAIAVAMYLAVRFGGGPCTGLPWRWGYGYPNCP